MEKILQEQGEVARIEPQRQMLNAKVATAQAELEHAKLRIKQIESARKDLELEVETKKQMIVRYANQQFQTRKNEEYRALAHEIDTCKAAIFQIENGEIELMEQAETAQKELLRATQAAKDARSLADDQIGQLDAREGNLKKELAQLEANREELAAAVDEGARNRSDVGARLARCGLSDLHIQESVPDTDDVIHGHAGSGLARDGFDLD